MTLEKLIQKTGFTKSQLTGKEEIKGYLDLRSVTTLPDGFNPTVGGSLYLGSGQKYIGAQVPELRINKNYFWNNNNKTYALIDGIFCEIISKKESEVSGQIITIYSARSIAKSDTFFVVKMGDYYAHGNELKQAVEDVQFKIASEKLKNEPISADTIISIKKYRLITGACEMGCNSWLANNNLTGVEEMRADKLLPLLKKTNAYGYEKFNQLVNF